MRVVRYDRELQRVWVCRARIHHGLAGFLLTAFGFWLMWDDRHDMPWLQDQE
jgi:hypothetical protein